MTSTLPSSILTSLSPTTFLSQYMGWLSSALAQGLETWNNLPGSKLDLWPGSSRALEARRGWA